MRVISLSALLVLLGCSDAGRSKVDSPDLIEGGSPAISVSICNLRSRAEREGLWGKLVRIEGKYSTDRQSFDSIGGDCLPDEPSALELTRILTLDQPGLEVMARAEEAKCGRDAFCSYSAIIVLDGVLVKSDFDDSSFGILIEPLNVVRFEILD